MRTHLQSADTSRPQIRIPAVRMAVVREAADGQFADDLARYNFLYSPQGRPCGPAATRRPPGHRPHRPGQPAPTPQPDRHVVLTRPRGHIGATPGGTTRDNSGQRQSVVAPGQPTDSGGDAGRPDTPVLSRTEEVGLRLGLRWSVPQRSRTGSSGHQRSPTVRRNRRSRALRLTQLG